jgi:hypothetical protein
LPREATAWDHTIFHKYPHDDLPIAQEFDLESMMIVRINTLPPTVLKDAQDIYNLLVDPQSCGYPKDNVELLLDKQETRGIC